MTQEEKAKAYDEAIKRLRNAFYDNNSRMCEEYRNAALKIIEPIFPELAESEDEKIRKALINGFNKLDKSAVWYNGITNCQIISWLEKQCEQKPEWTPMDEQRVENLLAIIEGHGYPGEVAWLNSLKNRVQPKQHEQKLVQEIEPTPIFKIGDILKRKGKDYTFRVDRIQGGYYHCDHNNGAFFPIEEQDNWELVEQKPAWSKEDEKMYTATIFALAGFMGNGDKLDWLKSLKDRVQPKKEWSKEDENRINRLIAYFEDKESFTAEDDIVYANWLKSLRPQNRWKPSEEMLEALYRVIPENVMEKSEDDMLLDKLYQGLKYGKVLSEK